MCDKYDDVLFSILKEEKTIPNFFNAIFGFLYRRTDFYHIAGNPNLGVGLPEGIAENLLFQAFKKYKNVVDKEIKQTENLSNKAITYQNDTNNKKEPPSSTATTTTTTIKTSTSEKHNEESNSYNGATYDNYSWSQTITDIDIHVRLFDKIPSKQLQVDVSASKVTVKLKNGDAVFLDGELCRKCKPQETIWSVDGHNLQIHLEKASEAWWDCLVQSEPKLDFNKMDCTRPFHELSEEAQAKIEELSWNQERKKQGLPATDQLDLEKILKKSWNVEGSPFSGEYDPTKVMLG